MWISTYCIDLIEQLETLLLFGLSLGCQTIANVLKTLAIYLQQSAPHHTTVRYHLADPYNLFLFYTARRGNITTKQLPSPMREVTAILPLCLFIIVFTIESPSPVPPDFRERALSTV